ncbi:hypothetical protein TSUD_144670 [Trifolium subterraneum]|uniref:Uncharacterized protein n=1 Tax=Trifolium subterraneum TaxID=3900 RepID=A0A2Z6MJU6_TRISU|nr:hypothetical protein TSUD_144670 [Trifolium subterraneum]
MEPRESNNNNQQGCGGLIKDSSSWCCQFKNASNPLMARYVYALIFLVANMLAWAARDELSSISALTELKGKIGFNP